MINGVNIMIFIKENHINMRVQQNIKLVNNAHIHNLRNAAKEFASAITKNCKPLNNKFSKLVDDNFWNLI
jgi:hypothetical protein